MKDCNEALVVLAKCGEVHKTYGIRAEKIASKHWKLTWAFPIKDSTAKREGYDKASISGNIEIGNEYPGCPYCRQSHFTVCSCGHLSCTVLKDGVFTCEWCGTHGTITDYTGENIAAGMDL